MNVPIIVIVGFLFTISAMLVGIALVLIRRNRSTAQSAKDWHSAYRYALRKCEDRAKEYAHKSNVVSDFAINFSEALAEELLLMAKANRQKDEEEPPDHDLYPNFIRVESLIFDAWDSTPSNLKGQLPFSEKLVKKIRGQ